MKLNDLTQYLEQIAPLRFQEKYDNAGLIYGDLNTELTGALISLDCTEEVINEAVTLGCNVVVSHHPIVFGGIKKFKNDHYADRTIISAIKNDVAIYAIHTNLDNVLRNGVNEKIGHILGLKNIKILKPNERDPMETDYDLGAGIIGEVKEPIDEISFLQFMKDRMNLKVIKHTALLQKPISRVAICGGSGSFLLQDAILDKADIFITSDFKYHEFFEANRKIMIADIGHYESEFFTIELLFELLNKKFYKFASHFTKVVTNPVKYF